MIKTFLIKTLLTITTTATINTATANKYESDPSIYMMTAEHGARVWMHTNNTPDIWDDFIFDYDDSFGLDMQYEYKHGAYTLYGYGLKYMMYGWDTPVLTDDIIADAEHGY